MTEPQRTSSGRPPADRQRSDGTAAARGWLPSVASGITELAWPLHLALVATLAAWVLVPVVALGWRPVAITSGSMGPVLRPGHVVLLEPFRGQDLRPGSVVTFRHATLDRLVTHRVVDADADGTWRTRGDANAADDPVPLTSDRIVGVGRLVVPAAGLPALWAGEGRIDLLAAGTAVTAFAAWGATRAWASRPRRYRRRRRVRRRRIAVAATTTLLVLGMGGSAVARAAFVGAGASGGNAFAAATVAAPTGLTASGGCGLIILGPKVDLAWNAVPGATGYQILRSTTSAGSGFSVLTTVTGTTHTDRNVSGNRTYHYRVRMVAGGWSSGPSTTATASTPLLCL